MKRRNVLDGIPLTALHPPTWDEVVQGYVGVKRLRDIEVTGTFTPRKEKQLEDHAKKGDAIWFEIPGSRPKLEVRCIIIKVETVDGRVASCVARPTGAPRQKRRKKNT